MMALKSIYPGINLLVFQRLTKLNHRRILRVPSGFDSLETVLRKQFSGSLCGSQWATLRCLLLITYPFRTKFIITITVNLLNYPTRKIISIALPEAKVANKRGNNHVIYEDIFWTPSQLSALLPWNHLQPNLKCPVNLSGRFWVFSTRPLSPSNAAANVDLRELRWCQSQPKLKRRGGIRVVPSLGQWWCWWWFVSQRGRNRSWAVEFAHQRSSFAMTTISLISDLVALFNEWRMNDWARAGHPYPSELSCGARVKNRINVGLFRVDKERQSTMAEVGPGGRITSQAMWIVFAGPLFRLFSSGTEYIRIQWAKTGETKISVLWKIEISLMR